MSLIVSLRSEILKTKRTASLYFTIIAALFGPFMSMLDAVFGEGVSAGDGPAIFNKMMTDKFQATSLVMFPLFIILICTLLAQVEYRNNTWKQVLSSPQKKSNIFLAKFINTHLLLLTFLIINILAMFLTVVVLHFQHPSLQVLSQPINASEIIGTRLNTYCALLGMIALQFWLGLRFKNFITALAIGISCWIIGSMLVLEFHSGIGQYFPYSFSAYSVFPKYKPLLNTILYTSAAYAMVVMALAFVDFKTRGSKA